MKSEQSPVVRPMKVSVEVAPRALLALRTEKLTTINQTIHSIPQDSAPRSVGFLLLEGFTLIALASAVAPLRMANQLSGSELYRWLTLSKGGTPVSASVGLKITPDAKMEEASDLHTVIVCGGLDIQNCVCHEHVRWLQLQARLSCHLGAVCTGSWALGKAGLLDGHKCSVHWECLASMREAFPKSEVTTRLYSIDGNHLTSSGGTAPIDMMLHLIRCEHGRDLAEAISDMLMHERMRSAQDHQRLPLRHTLGANQPKLQAAILLMEASLEEPLELTELAFQAGISRRQLERLFDRYLDCSPSRYYLKLRLVQARQLLKQTSLPVLEIGALCGFASTPHFARSYRGHFGVPPSDERASSNAVLVAPMPARDSLVIAQAL
ncbi:transcriptional regulator GlxA family with amidase domain [Pseudomonas sp. URMO17WK12:I6]|nr:transcriptional regulator GlxA family with amidase domain [Pseudomonas sp. URMO17WK12:I6]